MRLITTITVGIILSLLVCFFNPVQAEKATQTEMELVCQNWLSYMVYQKGNWAGNTHPQIIQVDEITEGDTLLARCFSISPRGYVAVPILKELPPVMAYSDEYPLDEKQAGGFSLLLKEVLLDRIRLYARAYGSLDAIQPPTGDVLMGRGQKAEWNRFLKSDVEFKSDLIEGKFQTLNELGPLLTTSWHQRSPYNYFCPRGDTTCITCPSGKPPTIPTVVGCVATATAQILRYWSQPLHGIGSHSYNWYGDNSCDGSSPSQNLYADYSDPYDWQHMPDSCDFGCAPEDTVALAELCYEVGVAFEMSYGVCGSGAYTADAEYVFPAYFGYDTSINIVERYYYNTPAEWFSVIQAEINQGRPMQYRIRSHSIVCDGWRDTGGQNQYHMNYGWGGSFTTWFAIDSLYCYWVLPDSLCPPDEEYLIRNIKPSNQPPDPFSLILPNDGDTVSAINTLSWQITYDPDSGDQIRYDLYLSTSPGFNPDSTTLYDSLVDSQLIDTLHVGIYYWKVKAYDNWGAERWSNQTWHFVYFIRGDVNMDGIMDVGDVVFLINYLFKNGAAPNPVAVGDINCDSIVDIGDVVYVINYLFKFGPPPGC